MGAEHAHPVYQYQAAGTYAVSPAATASNAGLLVDDIHPRKMCIRDRDEAWNYGASTSAYIPLFGKTLNLNAEYYYTDFSKQVVVSEDLILEFRQYP